MALPASYATASDLASYWRPLTDAEQQRATVLLGAAGDRINELAGAADANGNPAFVTSACKWVSLDMVKRAMCAPSGASAMSQTVDGEMTLSYTYANPAGDLYILPSEVDRLNGRYGPSAMSLTLTSDITLPTELWNYQPTGPGDGSI